MVYDEEKNNASLIAWNEWKKVCCISKCSEQNKEILTEELQCSIKRMVSRVFPMHARRLMRDFKNEGIAIIFDEEYYVLKDMNNEDTPPEQKGYKDMVWDCIGKDGEPPLKTIRGLIHGPHPQSLLNGIIRSHMKVSHFKVLEEYHNAHKDECNRITEQSIDDPITTIDGDERTLSDVMPDDTHKSIFTEDIVVIRREAKKLFKEGLCEDPLTESEAFAYLIDKVSIRKTLRMTDEDVKEYIGCGTTSCYEKVTYAERKINKALKDVSGENVPASMLYIRKILIPLFFSYFKQNASKKVPDSLLLRIRKAAEAKGFISAEVREQNSNSNQ